jgi:hypothetical protein
MKSFFCMLYSILSTLFLCITLLLANISFASELEDLTVKANQGDADSQFNLGAMYEKGHDVPED